MVFVFIEILFKILLFKEGVLIYAEHCIYIYIYIYIYIHAMPPGFCDSAIIEFIEKSSKRRNFPKSLQISLIAANFSQILGLRIPWRHHNAHSVKERLFLSLKNGMNSLHSHYATYKSYIGQTNQKRNESTLLVWATDRLSARTGAASCSRSRDTVIHSAVRYSEEKQSNSPQSRINNISVKSWEKHFNSMQNSFKATDIRTNATDVETRKNIVQ